MLVKLAALTSTSPMALAAGLGMVEVGREHQGEGVEGSAGSVSSMSGPFEPSGSRPGRLREGQSSDNRLAVYGRPIRRSGLRG